MSQYQKPVFYVCEARPNFKYDKFQEWLLDRSDTSNLLCLALNPKNLPLACRKPESEQSIPILPICNPSVCFLFKHVFLSLTILRFFYPVFSPTKPRVIAQRVALRLIAPDRA